jgi:flagellar biosynthesis anti-sigma factor FlgM
MMGKMNIHKIDGSTPIRAERQNDVKTPADEIGQPVEHKAVVGDKIEFSSRATEVTKLVDQIKQLPETREAKVAILREQIANGTLRHSGNEIADAILNDERA